MKFLLDEMLSPKLVAALAARGIYAVHIARLGRAGLSDAGLFRLAYDRDMAVVTMSVADYLTRAAGSDLHAGLIVLRVSGLSLEEQWAHLELVVDALQSELESAQELVNEVIEITGVGRFRRYPLP